MKNLVVVGVISAALMPCAGAGVLSAQTPEVFAQGVVTLEGDNVYRGTFHPDGGSFWFFRKVGDGEEYRIYRSSLVDGSWTSAERVDLGGDHSDLYPTFSPGGDVMVFASYRPTPSGSPPQANLWYVRVMDGGAFGEPVYLSEQSDPNAYDAGPLFDADGLLRWTSETWGPEARRLYRASRWDGAGFSPPHEDPTVSEWQSLYPDVRVVKAVFSPDRGRVVLEVRQVTPGGRLGTSDLWLAHRTEGGWSEPAEPGTNVNTDGFENFATFSADGRYLLYVQNFETYFRIALPPLDGMRPR